MKIKMLIILTFIFSLFLQASEIHKISDDVFAGQTTHKGKTVYFGMEKLDKTNLPHWQAYERSAYLLTKDARGLLIYLSVKSKPDKYPTYDEKIKEFSGFSEQEYKDFMDKLQRLKMYELKNREGIKGVPAGLLGWQEMLKDDGHHYVVYASKRPVAGKFPFKKVDKYGVGSIKEFVENYDDIIMSMGLRDYYDTPITEHRGIFRNPMDFLDEEKKYSGLSLKLHGFAGKIAKEFFPQKKYMDVVPTFTMEDILVKNLKPGDMFIGTNQRPISYEQFPPIVHVGKDKILRIAKEDVDLSKYPDHLPDELAQFVFPKDRWIRTGGTENTVFLIRLDALAHIFDI